MSPLPLSPFKKSIHKHFTAWKFHYSKSFKIFESIAEIFYPLKSLNLGTVGDHVENVSWRPMNLSIPPSLKNMIVLRGTNCLFTDYLWI